MARASYDLNEYATSTIKSMNGTTYTATIWWKGTGAGFEWTLGPSGAQIVYETETVDDKNSPIISSSLKFPVMVEDLTMQNFLNNLRNATQEKESWITIRVGTSGAYIWSGYIILDMENREDVSYPYETVLTAVDGIATLKDVPFIRETNSDTGATPTFPYNRADTYDNAGWQTIIGGTSSWLKILLDNVGQLLESDDASYPTSSELENYTIQTSFNWWNEDMVTPASTTDPLANMKISMRPFYSQDQEGTMDVPNCYDVLKDICINFGMRLIYWQNQFHFIQINEYNTDEQGSAPYSPPINIPTREYFYTGGLRANRNYLGNTNYSLYKQVFENATSPGTGLQKLAGSRYLALPAIKKTKGIYIEGAGSNLFTGFPLFVNNNTGSITPTAWPTSGGYVEYKQKSNFGGVEQLMQCTDAKDLAGFVCKIYGDFYNTSGSDIEMEMLWTIRAKPSDSAWGDADNMTMYKYQAATYAEFRWMSMSGEYPLANNQQYMRDYIWIPGNTGPSGRVTLEMFNSTTTSTTNTTNNLIPTDSSFAGSWDFQFYTFTGFEPGITNEMNAQGETALYSHGRITDVLNPSQSTAGGTTPIEEKKVPTYYAFDYEDTEVANYSPPFLSQFVPIASGTTEFGINTQSVQVEQDSSDTFVYKIPDVRFGDGTGANTFTTIQVYNGAAWVFVNENGKWAQGSYSWSGSAFVYATPTYDLKIIDILSKNILYNQSKSILTLDTNSALSETDKFFSGTTKLKFMNPIAKLIDTDNKEYMMMRGTFDLSRDQWSLSTTEVSYNIPTTVTTGTKTTRSQG